MNNLKKKLFFQLTLPQRIYAVYQQKGLKLTLYDIISRLYWNLCWYLYPALFKVPYNPNQKLGIVHKTSKKMQGKPEIVFFIGSLVAGGAERQVVRLAIELKAHGYATSIIVQNMGKEYSHYAPLALAEGVKISQFSAKNYISGLVYIYKQKLTDYFSLVPIEIRRETLLLIGKIHSKKNSILHCYLDSSNLIGGFAGVFTNTPTRLSLRSASPGFYLSEDAQWMHASYSTLLQHHLVFLESNCKSNYASYAKWLNISVPYTVLYNGIELSDVTATTSRKDMRKQLSIPETAPMILFIGRLSHEKKPLDFILVADKVLSMHKDAYFVQVGIGSLEQELKQLIQTKQLDHRIQLLGRRDDIPNLLHASNILLLTSQIEGMPNAVMEAMAAAIPVVSTRVGAVPELIEENVNGFTADPGDIEALSKAVIQLIENPTLAKRMGLAGQQRIKEHFSTKNLVQKVIAAYSEL